MNDGLSSPKPGTVRQTLDYSVLIAVVLLVAVLVVNAGLGYRNTRQLHEDAREVAHTNQVLDLSGDTLRALADAETGLRGFVITGKGEFLQDYEAALPTFGRVFRKLKDETKDSPAQQARLQKLEEMAALKLGFLQEVIVLRRQSAEDAAALIATGKGKTQMDAIRRLVQELEQVETDSLRDRQRASARAYDVAVTTGLLAAALGLAMVGAFVLLLHRSQRARGKAAADLIVSEERLKLAAEAGGVGIWDWNLVNDTLVWDDAMFALYGARREDFSGAYAAWAARLHPEDRAASEAAAQDAIAGRKDYPIEFRVNWPDGSVHHLEAHGRVFRDEAGHPVRMVGTNVDITVQKQAEESRARLAAIVESSQDAIVSKDLRGTITSWNRGAEAMFGFSAEEIVGQSILQLIPPERRNEEDEILGRVARGEGVRHFETVRRRKDGSTVEVSVTVSPLKDASGKVVGASKVARDFTEQKNAERTIREEAKRKDEFLAMLGHELRNPLNAIRHAVQISSETPDDREACQWAAKVIDRQSQQLTRMVEDLLDVARINRGRIELRVESLDLGPVLEQAIVVARPLLAQRHHTFTSDIGSQLRITGDAARLEQVFVNLLTNAAKYTPENGIISLRAQNEDGEVVVAITDNGVGISAELLPHVFDLFRQGDSTLDRAQGGLGIGLSVVKSLVEMHLGRVSVTSAGANAGTTVTVRLPLLHDPPAAAARPPEPAALAAAVPKALRVLIVDDHEDAAQALARLLKHRGCEVRCAHTGPDGVAAAREFLPAALLLDLGLPGFDGYEVARILRREAPFADAVFIAISGYAQTGDRERCLASGFNDHFAKPIDFPKLVEAIHSRCVA